MTSPEDFERAFTDFVRSTGRWHDVDPRSLTQRWVDFVDECARGYSRDLEDYFNDLTARSALEKAMREPALARFPQMDMVVAEVASADARLRDLMTGDVFPKFPENQWWLRGVVRSAGPKLVTQMQQQHHIKIDLA